MGDSTTHSGIEVYKYMHSLVISNRLNFQLVNLYQGQ